MIPRRPWYPARHTRGALWSWLTPAEANPVGADLAQTVSAAGGGRPGWPGARHLAFHDRVLLAPALPRPGPLLDGPSPGCPDLTFVPHGTQQTETFSLKTLK